MTRGNATWVPVLLAMMLAIATPALAQEEGGAFYSQGGESQPSPPDYAFRDGTVVVDGDSVTDCRSFVQGFDGGYSTWGDQEQAERVLEQCERAGSPSFANVPSEVRAEIRADKLPETGGVPLALLPVVPLLAGAWALLVLRGASAAAPPGHRPR